ncbi:MAG TPA: C40 family peptidase [Actinomycetota bacterium]|nr:C40 family peptidase [Actinomycetota bacterium]
MGRTTGERRGRWIRLAAAGLLALPLFLTPGPSVAAPSRAEIRAAEAELRALNERLSLLVEEYDQARLRLQQVQQRLADVRRREEEARSEAARARQLLSERAAQAFMGLGTQVDVLLEAGSLVEFSDRLEFIGQIAQSDADLATAADAAARRAAWLAQELRDVQRERAATLAAIRARQAEIRRAIERQEQLVADLQAAYRRARRAAAAVEEVVSGGTAPAPPPSSIPAPNPDARLAIQAAYSVLGTPYQWGGASPDTGFDCSGLTMWAWAQAGVSLPHSSAAQYAALPHVPREALQPGDLVFFYSPIHHVGLYIGGGRMIDAPHSGAVVAVRAVMWEHFVGAARPG